MLLILTLHDDFISMDSHLAAELVLLAAAYAGLTNK